MNLNGNMLKSLLPGLIPIFIFTIFDTFLSTTNALIAAITFSFCELLYYKIRYKTIDKFILFDVILISSLGGISIISDNPVFFKIKPAIIEGIMIIIMGVTAFTPANIILLMMKRYFRNINLNELQIKMIRKSSMILFIIFSIHCILIIYSAYFMSKEAWAFISGILFYIIFAIYMLFGIIISRHKIRRDIERREKQNIKEFEILIKQTNSLNQETPLSLKKEL